MDTSEKYILMCERADEIQKERPWDGYCKEYFRHLGDIWIDCNGEWWANINNRYVWLLRQDQLQEMVEAIDENNLHRLFRFNRFIEEHDYLPMTHQCPYIYFINLTDREDIEEQLWLAFVMHEKYQKRWDEEKGEWASA